jgi:hypothetical protein
MMIWIQEPIECGSGTLLEIFIIIYVIFLSELFLYVRLLKVIQKRMRREEGIGMV